MIDEANFKRIQRRIKILVREGKIKSAKVAVPNPYKIDPRPRGFVHRIDAIPGVFTPVEIILTDGAECHASVIPALREAPCIGGEVAYQTADRIIPATDVLWWKAV